MVLPEVHYYWQITDGRRDRTSRLQLLDVTTSTRDRARRPHRQPIAEPRRDGTSGRDTSISCEPRTWTLHYHDIERKNVYIISRGGS